MALGYKETHHHDTDTINIHDCHDAMNATQLSLHQLEKKITELTRHQERKKSLLQALESDSYKININYFQLKQFVNNRFNINSKYYNSQSIFYYHAHKEKKYHYEEAFIKKIPVIH